MTINGGGALGGADGGWTAGMDHGMDRRGVTDSHALDFGSTCWCFQTRSLCLNLDIHL